MPLPAAIDFNDAAAVMQQGMTAHYLADSTFALAPGHTALVHAAAGGTVCCSCKWPKFTARAYRHGVDCGKSRARESAGADEVILYTEQDFAAEVRRLTSGRGVDVVYDSVGKTTYEKSLECLAPRGMLVIFGQSSGPVPPFDTAVLNAKGSLFLARPSLTHHVATMPTCCAAPESFSAGSKPAGSKFTSEGLFRSSARATRTGCWPRARPRVSCC
jgi:NADPH2:quinone reductase